MDVVLGPHAYSLAMGLVVPANTRVVGSGAGSTRLTFNVTDVHVGVAFAMAANTTLANFSVVVAETTTKADLVVFDVPRDGFKATGLSIDMRQPYVGTLFNMQGSGFEILRNSAWQTGNCSRSVARVVMMHKAVHGRIAENHFWWRCAAFGADVTDEVVMEDNVYNCTDSGNTSVPGGSFIATYDLYHHPSARFWASSKSSNTPRAA